MAANFVREDSRESLEPRSESDSYATSEEKTDSGLVPSSNDTSDTSVQTSDTSGVESHDLEPSEPREAALPEGGPLGSAEASGGAPTGKSPGKQSLISKAKDLVAKVARSFSPKKDTMEEDAVGSKEATVEKTASQAKEEATSKRSLVQKCVDRIISPKKTCGLEALNPCESMNVDQSAPAADSNEERRVTRSKFSGEITLRPSDQGEDKPASASPSEVSQCSTMAGIETDLSSPSSTDETNRGSSEQKMAEVLEQPESPENMDDKAGDESKDGSSSGTAS